VWKHSNIFAPGLILTLFAESHPYISLAEGIAVMTCENSASLLDTGGYGFAIVDGSSIKVINSR
jgi:hypothetical protein